MALGLTLLARPLEAPSAVILAMGGIALKRIGAVLEGQSLIDDASALVLHRFVANWLMRRLREKHTEPTPPYRPAHSG